MPRAPPCYRRSTWGSQRSTSIWAAPTCDSDSSTRRASCCAEQWRPIPAIRSAHLELAKTYDALQDSAAAMREYERALQLAPTLEEAHYGFAILAGRDGREGDGFYHLGVAFKLRGEFDKAVSQFEKAEPLLPAGSTQAQAAHAEIAELKEFLRHARLTNKGR